MMILWKHSILLSLSAIFLRSAKQQNLNWFFFLPLRCFLFFPIENCYLEVWSHFFSLRISGPSSVSAAKFEWWKVSARQSDAFLSLDSQVTSSLSALTWLSEKILTFLPLPAPFIDPHCKSIYIAWWECSNLSQHLCRFNGLAIKKKSWERLKLQRERARHENLFMVDFYLQQNFSLSKFCFQAEMYFSGCFVIMVRDASLRQKPIQGVQRDAIGWSLPRTLTTKHLQTSIRQNEKSSGYGTRFQFWNALSGPCIKKNMQIPFFDSCRGAT